MTGPEHYRAAEMYLAEAKEKAEDARKDAAYASEWYQRQAQVHATLALVAASAKWRVKRLPVPGEYGEPEN